MDDRKAKLLKAGADAFDVGILSERDREALKARLEGTILKMYDAMRAVDGAESARAASELESARFLRILMQDEVDREILAAVHGESCRRILTDMVAKGIVEEKPAGSSEYALTEAGRRSIIADRATDVGSDFVVFREALESLLHLSQDKFVLAHEFGRDDYIRSIRSVARALLLEEQAPIPEPDGPKAPASAEAPKADVPVGADGTSGAAIPLDADGIAVLRFLMGRDGADEATLLTIHGGDPTAFKQALEAMAAAGLVAESESDGRAACEITDAGREAVIGEPIHRRRAERSVHPKIPADPNRKEGLSPSDLALLGCLRRHEWRNVAELEAEVPKENGSDGRRVTMPARLAHLTGRGLVRMRMNMDVRTYGLTVEGRNAVDGTTPSPQPARES